MQRQKNEELFNWYCPECEANLRGPLSVFVGQCEVFVCLGFVSIISFLYSFPWP